MRIYIYFNCKKKYYKDIDLKVVVLRDSRMERKDGKIQVRGIELLRITPPAGGVPFF